MSATGPGSTVHRVDATGLQRHRLREVTEVAGGWCFRVERAR